MSARSVAGISHSNSLTGFRSASSTILRKLLDSKIVRSDVEYDPRLQAVLASADHQPREGGRFDLLASLGDLSAIDHHSEALITNLQVYPVRTEIFAVDKKEELIEKVHEKRLRVCRFEVE
jgi:hypothetical protein